jgi:hypothetical protein
LLNDYEARLGWKFETLQQQPEVVRVTTQVEINKQFSLKRRFGYFERYFPPFQNYMKLEFSPHAGTPDLLWENNSLAADFLADYIAVFLNTTTESGSEAPDPEEVKETVSFIANEILENAIQFSDSNSSEPVTISVQLHSDRVVFLSTNSISSQLVPQFQAYIQRLLVEDPTELYVLQAEKNAEDEMGTGSGLGLLTILRDYQAKLGWQFETVQQHPEQVVLTTMVQCFLQQ